MGRYQRQGAVKQDREVVVGVDVGTLSTRAGIFNLNGDRMGSASRPISIFHPQPDFVEQSSEDIWENTGFAIREALKQAQVPPGRIVGISFDATCSLVSLDRKHKPITLSSTGDPLRNIIVWMDHRAIKEADFVNQTNHPVLAYVGGKISPEQQPPKLKWIKENLPETWARAGKFMDLADFMVFRATGSDKRSLCTHVCKWTYLGHVGKRGSWDHTFFEKIGLLDLFDGGKVPASAYSVGSFAGTLRDQSARELGLRPGVTVGVGIIDAHAGGIGLLGDCAKRASKDNTVWDKTLALIGGTSSCHMATSDKPRFIPGVWGPYFGAMIPRMWLNEGGQSATGSLIDYVIKNNSNADGIETLAKKSGLDIYHYLNREVKKYPLPHLTKDIHILPYHHGNRSPRADTHARGVVVGLTLDQSIQEVAKQYYATIQAIAYGTRHIIEAMNEKGYAISEIYMCGGHAKNDLFVQEHADVTGCRIYLPEEKEAVLLGAAVLAAVASGRYRSINEAMKAMSRVGEMISPQRTARKYHDGKYRIFKKMYEHFKEIRRLAETL
jgi:FGGY-family pentulose kinase